MTDLREHRRHLANLEERLDLLGSYL